MNFPNTTISAFACGNTTMSQTHAPARFVFGTYADQWTPGSAIPGALSTNVSYHNHTSGTSVACSSGSPCAPYVFNDMQCTSVEEHSSYSMMKAYEDDLANNCIQHH